MDYSYTEEERKEMSDSGSKISCPPTAPVSTSATLLLLLGLLYGTCWALVGNPVLPGGSVFGLLSLGVLSFLGGKAIRIIRIPSLVGSMVVGFMLQNIPHINVAKDIPDEWAEIIRNCALVMILIRAGLELDSDVLRKHSLACSELVLIPFAAECLTAAIVSHFLFDMTWIWSFLLGFMLAAVSPAVVLPVMLKLKKKGIGSSSGIHTMVIAVAGLDDVLAVTGFEVILGFLFFTQDSMAWMIARGPVQILVGITFGIVLGLITWYLPNPEEKSHATFRFLLLCLGGLFIFFVSDAFDWGATGALGCICFPFVAAFQWKKEGWDTDESSVSKALSFVWRIIEPFLFGLVGSEIKIEYLHPNTVGLALAILFTGLALRIVTCLLSAYMAGLTLKEQVFVTFAGLPKATVQAAIGPTAFHYAIKNDLSPEIKQYGIEILTVAVLSILIAAPLGAIAISLLAPRLLSNSNSSDCLSDKEAGGKTNNILDSTSNGLNFYSTNKNQDTKISSISSDISEFTSKL